VVVHNFYIKGISVLPAKANPPLIIDSDTVLSFAIAFQSFEPVTGRDLEFVKALCLVQVQELPAGDPFNGPIPRHVLVAEQGLGPGVAEGTDHCRSDYYAARDMSNATNAQPGWAGSGTSTLFWCPV
jgi:hypothetical protein